MAQYYPIFLGISGRQCLIVGGGAVAARKTIGLLESGASVRVVSPELSPKLEDLASSGEIEVVRESYKTAHLENTFLVYAATNDRAVNAGICSDAHERNILVNSADAPQEGDFIVPSVVRRGEFCIAVSTGGNNPMLASRVSGELETRFGPEYGEFVEIIGEMRNTIKSLTDDEALRRSALAKLLDFDSEILELLRSGKQDEARSWAMNLVNQVLL